MTRESRLTSLDPSRWPQRIGSAPLADPTVAQQSAGTVTYVCTCFSRAFISFPRKASWGADMIGTTLARYLSMRFFNTIMLVFLTICGTVYVVDFVEMLRRASNHPGVTPVFVAFLSFLRTPSVAEQVLPFCVLFGTMTAFIDLTRRLELIIARAAGVSVWQFMLPPVGIALFIGITSITVLNPVSAQMKQRADAIEDRLFGSNGQSEGDTELWIRQTSVDGQAFLHGDESSDGGAKLLGVNGYLYDQNGHFDMKVKAEEGQLTSGIWRLKNVLLTTPGQEAMRVGTFLIASNVAPEHLGETFLAPSPCPSGPYHGCVRKPTPQVSIQPDLACNIRRFSRGPCCSSRWS